MLSPIAEQATNGAYAMKTGIANDGSNFVGIIQIASGSRDNQSGFLCFLGWLLGTPGKGCPCGGVVCVIGFGLCRSTSFHAETTLSLDDNKGFRWEIWITLLGSLAKLVSSEMLRKGRRKGWLKLMATT